MNNANKSSTVRLLRGLLVPAAIVALLAGTFVWSVGAIATAESECAARGGILVERPSTGILYCTAD